MVRSVRFAAPLVCLLLADVASAPVAPSSAPADFLNARAAFLAAGDKGDKAAYATYLAPDATWIDISGGLRNRAALIANVVPPTSAPAPPTPIDVFAYPGGVVVTGHRNQNNSRFIQAWVKRGTEWLLVAHQGAPERTAPPLTGTPSAPPVPLGDQSARNAVWANIDALAVAVEKGDTAAFSRLVTEQFVSVSTSGALTSKSERLAQLRQSGPGLPRVVPQDISTRIHGTMAVTVDRSGPRADGSTYPPSRRTVVSVLEGGVWREAASIVTRIASLP